MPKLETEGVKAKPLERRAATIVVADNGMPYGSAMYAELIGAACHGFKFEQRFVSKTLLDAKPRLGMLSVGLDIPELSLGISADGLVDHALVIDHTAVDHRKIAFCDHLSLEMVG